MFEIASMPSHWLYLNIQPGKVNRAGWTYWEVHSVKPLSHYRRYNAWLIGIRQNAPVLQLPSDINMQNCGPIP